LANNAAAGNFVVVTQFINSSSIRQLTPEELITRVIFTLSFRRLILIIFKNDPVTCRPCSSQV